MTLMYLPRCIIIHLLSRFLSVLKYDTLYKIKVEQSLDLYEQIAQCPNNAGSREIEDGAEKLRAQDRGCRK